MGSQRQHFVPEFLLAGFVGPTGRLFCYDKWSDRVFETSPEKAAKENGFYDFELQGVFLTLEPALADLEAKTAPIIRKIIETRTLLSLPVEERETLALFCCAQIHRDKNAHAAAVDLEEKIAEFARNIRGPEGQIAEYKRMTPEDTRLISLKALIEAPKYVPLFLNKNWSLQLAPANQPFYISDSPVTFDNHRQFGFYGNIGLGVPGIQIALPLSSTLNLWITCPTIGAEFRSEYQKASLSGVPISQKSMRDLKAVMDSFKGEKPYVMMPEHIDRANSLQVAKCERFLYSASNDFSVAKNMIAKFPETKKGRRMRVD